MKRTLIRFALFVIAALAGWGTSEILLRYSRGRELVARVTGSADTVQADVNLRAAASSEVMSEGAIDYALGLFRDQFGDDARFDEALRMAGLSLGELRTDVAAHLRAQAWIEKQIAPALRVSDEDIRAYYETNRARFVQPVRYRANHLFVAAPEGAPPEVIAAKQSVIQGLSIRRIGGESFAALIAEASEDEATKTRGGDLNFFSSARVPPEFVDEIRKLQPGEISAPVRSHLGFHIVQLTEAKPRREMKFEEVRAEIAFRLANDRRALAVASLRERLSTPEFHRD